MGLVVRRIPAFGEEGSGLSKRDAADREHGNLTATLSPPLARELRGVNGGFILRRNSHPTGGPFGNDDKHVIIRGQARCKINDGTEPSLPGQFGGHSLKAPAL
jgi:hypothetical protein